MKHKKLGFIFIFSVSIFSLIFFIPLFIIDPLKLFHKPWYYKQYLDGNMRQQAAGIINNWNFDSLILGTSALENTSALEASKLLNKKFINISLSGSTYYERKIILDYALKSKKIKTVIYSLDKLGSTERGRANGTYRLSEWDYLYDNNPFNDFKAYINDKYLQCVFMRKNGCQNKKSDFDRPNAWYNSKINSIRFGSFENWFKVKKDKQVIYSLNEIHKSYKATISHKYIIDYHFEEKILKVKSYIDDNLINIIAQHPQTEFILILPSSSRALYATWEQYDKNHMQMYIESLKYLILTSEKYHNAKIYGWGNEKFLDNLANYKDIVHYHHTYNSWMLKAIKKNIGRLSSANITNYLNEFKQKAHDYNLTTLEMIIRKHK